MKKIFYKITILSLLVGLFASCDSELDQLPFDEFAVDNAFVTASDFENGIRGVYQSLTVPSTYGGSDAGSMISAPDVMADNVTYSPYGRGTKSTLHNWRYNPTSSTMRDTYRDFYSLIYKANLLLFYAETFNGVNKENVVAEAKALRALAHFNMVSLWGKIPTQSGDANGSLGIAYVVDAEANIQPARETVGEVYDKIVQDLKDAATGINESNPEGRMNKDAVNILLSRVYLYMGQWQNAVNAANAVTLNVAPRADVVGVWEDSNRSGLAFYIPNETGVLGNSIGVAWSQGGLNNLIPEYVASYELFTLYAADDIRKDAYIMPAANAQQGLQFNAIKKLFGRTGQSNGQVDYKIFRAAEAYLNKAEALFMLGNENGARTALDVVRTNRYLTPPSGETGNALRDAIRLERRLEFAFEYQRFFDIKRWGESVERENFGPLADGSGQASDQLFLEAGSYKFQLPIAIESMNQNPNLRQNPGY
jgi:hypothetical protein